MKTILLIEDDKVMRENTAEILELASFKVVTAENGKEGSQLAKKVKPALIICDIMMPLLDGYGVLHIISRDPETAGIPFIFLTAKAEKSDMRKGMELGADDYLTKPFEDTELLSAVEARLKKSQAVKKDFGDGLQGLTHFLDAASSFDELKNLSTKRSPSQYRKKEVIFHEGDEPQYVFLLNKGKVKVYKTHDDGKEYITNVYKDGDFFGHMSLFEAQPYSDSAIVLEDSEIVKVPKDDFLNLIYKNRDVASQFIKMLAGHIEEQEKQLLSLAYDSVRKRAAEALLLLQKRFEKDGQEQEAIRATREDLAGIAGTATETLIRCLGEFKEDGLIEVKGREIKILNKKGLQSIS